MVPWGTFKRHSPVANQPPMIGNNRRNVEKPPGGQPFEGRDV